MRLRAATMGAALLLSVPPAAAACSDAGDARSAATLTLPPERARDGETIVRDRRTGRSADMRFTVLGVSQGLTEVMGTHDVMGAQGAFTRVRILAVNEGRDIQVFDTWRQRLVTRGGAAVGPDVNATMVKRQPERLSVGSAMRAEFDLWFDVPKGTRARAVRLYGSPTVGAVSDPPAAEIPLP